MITRNDILCEAAEKCMKELYSLAQPHIDWEDFLKQNKEYRENGEKGPKPYEFYYLPQKIFEEVVDNYVYAYNLKSRFEDHLDIILEYFNRPIVDKYIPGENGNPGHRGYDYLIPLSHIIGDENIEKVKDYIEKARGFYRFDGELNSFKMTVCLGASPSSNKQAVIDNWKKYRNKDIVIDESVYEEEE